jgi:hypothetical protein
MAGARQPVAIEQFVDLQSAEDAPFGEGLEVNLDEDALEEGIDFAEEGEVGEDFEAEGDLEEGEYFDGEEDPEAEEAFEAEDGEDFEAEEELESDPAIPPIQFQDSDAEASESEEAPEAQAFIGPALPPDYPYHEENEPDSDDENAPERPSCLISHKFLLPISQISGTPSGHFYKTTSIKEWLEKNPVCPVTKEQLTVAQLNHNTHDFRKSLAYAAHQRSRRKTLESQLADEKAKTEKLMEELKQSKGKVEDLSQELKHTQQRKKTYKEKYHRLKFFKNDTDQTPTEEKKLTGNKRKFDDFGNAITDDSGRPSKRAR